MFPSGLSPIIQQRACSLLAFHTHYTAEVILHLASHTHYTAESMFPLASHPLYNRGHIPSGLSPIIQHRAYLLDSHPLYNRGHIPLWPITSIIQQRACSPSGLSQPAYMLSPLIPCVYVYMSPDDERFNEAGSLYSKDLPSSYERVGNDWE